MTIFGTGHFDAPHVVWIMIYWPSSDNLNVWGQEDVDALFNLYRPICTVLRKGNLFTLKNSFNARYHVKYTHGFVVPCFVVVVYLS